MEVEVSLDNVYKCSNDIVARDIQEELIIIPIVSGVGDLEDEIFTFNPSGRAIWDKLDGIKTLREIAKELAAEHNISLSEMENDVIGLTKELLKRKMLIEVKRD